MSKLEKTGKFRLFRPWQMTFRAIQSNPALDSWLVPSLERFMPKYRKSYRPIFWENGLKCKILTFRPIEMTFRAIQPNHSYNMLLMSSQRSFMPKKEKKVTEAF